MFAIDLNDGKKGEYLTAALFRNKNCDVVPNPALTPPEREYYDLLVTPKGKSPFTVECKFDYLSCVTKNVTIEHTCFVKSRATYYVYLVVTPYLVELKDIHWLAFNPDFRQVNGGDGKKAQFEDNPNTLVPIDHPEFKKYFKLIK